MCNQLTTLRTWYPSRHSPTTPPRADPVGRRPGRAARETGTVAGRGWLAATGGSDHGEGADLMSQQARDQLGRFGIWRGERQITPELAARIEELGFGALWLGSASGDLIDALVAPRQPRPGGGAPVRAPRRGGRPCEHPAAHRARRRPGRRLPGASPGPPAPPGPGGPARCGARAAQPVMTRTLPLTPRSTASWAAAMSSSGKRCSGSPVSAPALSAVPMSATPWSRIAWGSV